MSLPDDLACAPRLRGDLGVWLIILAELLTFGIFFVSYAFARSRDVAGFNASQATLDLHSGALNTVLLITGSWCVARAVHAVRSNERTAGLHWLLAAMACGAGFGGVKVAEYAAKLNAGIDLTSNTFYTLYLMLTAFHFLHVIVALLALGYLALRLHRGAYGSHDMHAMETGAAFWHMVDLLWIVLFALVYVLH
jgi:nitric oxide reductase NorE protein